jgi:hypothetical protein
MVIDTYKVIRLWYSEHFSVVLEGYVGRVNNSKCITVTWCLFFGTITLSLITTINQLKDGGGRGAFR